VFAKKTNTTPFAKSSKTDSRRLPDEGLSKSPGPRCAVLIHVLEYWKTVRYRDAWRVANPSHIDFANPSPIVPGWFQVVVPSLTATVAPSQIIDVLVPANLTINPQGNQVTIRKMPDTVAACTIRTR
jgi:hypothetical protein